MSDNGRVFLESIGWDYINTESAARIVADRAQTRIEELEKTLRIIQICVANLYNKAMRG